jgi:hypothetical protein
MFGSVWDPNKKQFIDNQIYIHYLYVIVFKTMYNTNPLNPFFLFTSYEFRMSGTMENAEIFISTEFPKP